MKEYTDPKYWEELIDKEKGSERVAYSDDSQNVRIPLIVAQMEDKEKAKVFDIGCGISYLDQMGGPFKEYVGMDFCEKSLAEDVNLSKSPNYLFVGDVRDPNFYKGVQGADPDYTVISGLLMIAGLFESYADALDFMIDCCKFTKKKVIGNFFWDKYIGQKDGAIRADAIDNISLYLMKRNLGGRVLFGHLPHEFLVVLDPNKKDISVGLWI